MVNVCISIPYMDFMDLKPQTCFFQIPIFPLLMGYVMTIWKVYDVFTLPFVNGYFPRNLTNIQNIHQNWPYSKPKSPFSTPSFWVSILVCGVVSTFQDEKDSPHCEGANLAKKHIRNNMGTSHLNGGVGGFLGTSKISNDHPEVSETQRPISS